MLLVPQRTCSPLLHCTCLPESSRLSLRKPPCLAATAEDHPSCSSGGRPQTRFRREREPLRSEPLTADEQKAQEHVRDEISRKSLHGFMKVGPTLEGKMGADMSGVYFAAQMRNSYDAVAVLLDEELFQVHKTAKEAEMEFEAEAKGQPVMTFDSIKLM
mmetsp:Transcript_433/g.958  ORF Transcript_433/g.958 Transcript_433/m.958 type:complete len:159 (+) Transcript_433:117-593(+)